jgi:hypothetical protein
MNQQRPAIFLLLGFPGAGKYTTAVELVRLLSGLGAVTRLLDNHRVSNILFDLIAEADGSSPLPVGIFPRLRDINNAVLRTIRELSPADWSFVMTHYLTDNPANRKYVDEIHEVAHYRNGRFIPIVLSAELGELLDRIPSQERRDRQKLVDPDVARAVVESGDLLVPDNAIHIDVTASLPVDTARSILRLAGNA